MKKIIFLTAFIILSFLASFAQDVKVNTCYLYMDENNRFSSMFEATNIRPDDTLEFIEFTFFLFSSQSNLKENYYHVVPLYNNMNLEHVPGNKACFGAFTNAEYNKTIEINNISWRDNGWYTKMDDVLGARILEVRVRYKSGYATKLSGFPKNSRVRKGKEHPPFYL